MLEAVGFIQLLACAFRVVSGGLAAFSARGATKMATRKKNLRLYENICRPRQYDAEARDIVHHG